MKLFILKFLFLCLAISCVSFTVDRYYRNIYNFPYPFPEHFFPEPPIEQKYQIVKVGNSHASDGITLKGFKLRSLDLAGIAQRFSHDLAMLKQYHNQIEPNAIIIIDATHLSFSHQTVDQNNDIQTRYYHILSPFLSPSLNVSGYIQTEILPFTSAGYMLREYNSKAVEKRLEEERERQKESDSPAATAIVSTASANPVAPLTTKKEITDYNVDAIKAELEHPTVLPEKHFEDDVNFIFHKWYYTDEFNQKYFEANRKDLAAIIDYCLKQSWRPVVITTPVVSDLEKALLGDYKQVYLYDNLQKTNLQSAPYVDFSNNELIRNDRSLFKNSDHLSVKGSIIFSYVLMKEFINRGYLPPEVDGYDYTPLSEYRKKS